MAVVAAPLVLRAAFAPSIPQSPFTHRALNDWITDLATDPDPKAAWPSMRLDRRLLGDYRKMFALMRRLGFNEIVIWGLYVSNHWPLNLETTVTPERGRLVERLIAEAWAQGIKVLSGLGVYSWGFAEIIKANPKLNGGNGNTMCASEPESHVWMERVVELVFKRFPIDRVSMQSADQGRCPCARCSKIPEAEYHAMLLERTARLIRSRWPGKIVGMSNWGVTFGRPSDRATFARLGASLDYIIDYNDSARHGGAGYRRELIMALPCAYGTSGGPMVEPPQHWARSRWFLPTCRRVHAHLQKLHGEGGRACEFFFHIAANPSSELTLHVAGRTLAAPTEPLENHLNAALDELYRPNDVTTRAALAKFFLDAEEAYMRHLPPEECGTISLEPLIGDHAGPAVYLRDRLNATQREMYARDVDLLSNIFSRLRSNLGATARADAVVECLESVRSELKTIART